MGLGGVVVVVAFGADAVVVDVVGSRDIFVVLTRADVVAKLS